MWLPLGVIIVLAVFVAACGGMTRVRQARKGSTMRRVFAAATLLACVAYAGCGEEKKSPVSPSPTVAVSTTEPANGPAKGAAQVPFHLLHPVQFPMDQGIVAFPPRNEPNTFFTDLQALYRDYLKRSQTAMSYVDAEGENVWLTEYFRFYLNGCSHAEATSRTLSEIRTGTTSPVCGGESLVFPPRNLPNEFQAALEATYHEILGRPQSASYVDSEGANVWLAEYLRYRVAGNCNHAEAENKVFAQIQGHGVQPVCGGASSSGTVQALDWDMWDYTVSDSGNRQVAIRLSWSSSSDDLDLYLTSGTCYLYPPFFCDILQSSDQSTGTSEYLAFTARGGDHFHVWVDNFTDHPVTYVLTTWNLPGVAAVEAHQEPVFSAGPVSRGHKPAGAKKIP